MASSCRTASRRRATRPGHLDEKRVGRVERLFVDRHSLTGTTNRQSQRRDLDRVHARAAGVPLPTVRRPEVQPWSAAELAQFLRYASTDRLGPVYELIAACELRRGEALGVRWAVDFARRVLYVRQTLTDVGGQHRPRRPNGDLVEDAQAFSIGITVDTYGHLSEDTARAASGAISKLLDAALDDAPTRGPRHTATTTAQTRPRTDDAVSPPQGEPQVRSPVRVEPPIGIEPMTCSLRVSRSAD